MIVRQLFSTPVVTGQVDLTPADADQFITALRMLAGSYTDEQMPRSPLNELLPFHASIERAVLDSFSAISPQYEWTLCSIKLNTITPGQMQQIHMHRDVDAFAVLYLSAGPVDSGHLRVYDPRFIDHVTIRPSDALFTLPPSFATFVAAPSYVWHSVDLHQGPRDRISVVYNGTTRKKTDG